MSSNLSCPKKFVSSRKNVCVLGLGFVGSAMALAVADVRSNNQPMYNVIGIDLPNASGIKKVESINKGIFPFENSDKKLQSAQQRAFEAGNLFAVTDDNYLSLADIIVVDINLDVKYNPDGSPLLDLSAFKKAITSIGQKINPNTLVIVETTVPPGACEKVALPIIKEEFKKRNLPENSVLVAHSYERVMPGEHYFDSIVNYWRVYSGTSDLAADKCEEFLKTIINVDKYPLTRLAKTTATETAKVLENSYRAANIAFIEEWGRFAEQVGIDLFEVISAIRMRPTHSNMRQPGFGVGGYCLTKDPYFASLAAKDIFGIDDLKFTFSTQAVKINNEMPLVSLNKIEKLLGGSLKNRKILLLGVSYRQDVGDTRYSPSEIFAKEAIRRGADVVCHDPLVKYWEEMKINVLNNIPTPNGFDVVMFAVPHQEYIQLDIAKWLGNEVILIFDANNVLSEKQRDAVKHSNSRLSCIGRA